MTLSTIKDVETSMNQEVQGATFNTTYRARREV